MVVLLFKYNLNNMTRNQEIVELYISKNWTYEKIGSKYGITRERVRQILHSQLLPYQLKELKKEISINRHDEFEKNRQTNICKQCGNKTKNSKFCSVSCSGKFKSLDKEEKRKRHNARMRAYNSLHPEKQRAYYLKRKEKINRALKLLETYPQA